MNKTIVSNANLPKQVLEVMDRENVNVSSEQMKEIVNLVVQEEEFKKKRSEETDEKRKKEELEKADKN